MSSYVVIDFETASAVDLKKAGAWVYSESPTTEVLCLGYQPAEGGVTVLGGTGLCFGYDMPLSALVEDPAVLFIAHNVGFEKAIWRNIMVPDFGWPDIPDNRWHDTMAVCAMKALPLALDRVSAVLRLDTQKDTEGSRITKALSKCDKKGRSTITPEKLQRVYDYNAQDVRGETELAVKVGPFQAGERRVWLLDQRINQRGVRIDLDFVLAAQKIVDAAAKPLATEFADLTGGLKATQRAKLLAWVKQEGVNVADLKKETLDRLLGAPDDDEEGADAEAPDDDVGEDDLYHETPLLALPPAVRRALEIRRILGSASIKKLASMRACVCADGRVRGLLQYHGAGPGRWAGRLLQPQNFPRGTLKVGDSAPPPELVVPAILSGDFEYVESIFGGTAIEVVASSLRHALVPGPGRLYVVGDFATIEARIVLALAGQHDKVKLLADGADIYVAMAQEIYKRPIDKKKDPAERQTGKNSVLGLGFQMGWPKFKARYAKDDTDEFCQGVVKTYREEFAPEVPKLWRGLEEAALHAVRDHRAYEHAGVVFAHEEQWLTARLPSGRKLYYYGPQMMSKAMPWDETDVRLAWTCWAQKAGRWIKRDMYGGLLTENVVQALARDLMVDAMFKVEKAGLPVVLTVHDEIVCEVDAARADPKVLDQIMRDRPQWAIDLGVPVAAECWSGNRYKK